MAGIAYGAEIDFNKGYVEYYNVFNEAKGYVKVIDKRIPDNCG